MKSAEIIPICDVVNFTPATNAVIK
jgi:hypothetical protein